MNSTVKIIVIALIIIAGIAFAFVPGLLGENKEADDTPRSTSQRSAKLPVTATLVEAAPLDNNLRITGSLLANESVVIRSEVAGIVERIYFKEGQEVKKGQLLVQIDNDELQAEIEKLEFTRKLNEDIEYRQKQLLAREAISQEEYETSLTTLNTIRAELKLKQVQLSKRQIRAPFNGIIGLRRISEGAYLNPADNIGTLYNINPIKIDFAVPGKYASEVGEGDKISFTTDASDQRFTGTIYALEPQVDPATRTLQVRALSNNEEGFLLPGQFAKIQLTLETYESALMIPSQAVIPELNGKKVFVSQKGIAVSKNITTGIRTSDKIQVITGLDPGDTLITSGMQQLQQGTPVELNFESFDL
jgi:membrane fusion protein (multidrug efflux system)